MPATIAGQRVRDVRRRAKYLMIDLDAGSLILHLGMSGSLRVLDPATPLVPHDHYDLVLESGRCLRFNDPRRFGSLHWSEGDPADHPLLAALGPEPLTSAFNADYLARRARGRRVTIKQFLMDQRVVVGVGNIYASEALFRAGVHPRRAAGRVSGARLAALVEAVRAVLGEAIRRAARRCATTSAPTARRAISGSDSTSMSGPAGPAGAVGPLCGTWSRASARPITARAASADRQIPGGYAKRPRCHDVTVFFAGPPGRPIIRRHGIRCAAHPARRDRRHRRLQERRARTPPQEHGAEVQVVMTAAARQFVTPLTFQAVSGRPVRTDLWDEAAEAAMGHIELARWADRILVAPATADSSRASRTGWPRTCSRRCASRPTCRSPSRPR